ncbi:MAG TPA: dethiobiotin synthase [Polyangia bacterium]|nr:dethiobiotin synthase [Polyangia bacterium]
MSGGGPGVFVVGTDTGVGKTTVAVGLTRLLANLGHRPVPFKPVETGCAPGPLDATRLWRAAGRPVALTDVCPFPLPLPAAPAAAAAEENVTLSLADLAARAAALRSRGDCLVVEGAGGLLAPYGPRFTNADLAGCLGLPIVLVGRVSLGTINHVALTCAELARRQLEVAALVLVRTERALAPHEPWNARLIEQTTGVAPRGTIPWLSPTEMANDDRLAEVVGAVFPGTALDELLGF